jgi:predicted kinase
VVRRQKDIFEQSNHKESHQPPRDRAKWRAAADHVDPAIDELTCYVQSDDRQDTAAERKAGKQQNITPIQLPYQTKQPWKEAPAGPP